MGQRRFDGRIFFILGEALLPFGKRWKTAASLHCSMEFMP
jgi:hypothetical protein